MSQQGIDDYDKSMYECRHQSIAQIQSGQQQIDRYLNLHDPSQSSQQESQHPVNTDQPKCNYDMQIDMYLEYPTNHLGHKQIYLAESREHKINRYLKKKRTRIWNKKIAYACRQKVAQDRIRVKGRFISTKKQQIPTKCSKEENSICPPTPPSLALKAELTQCPNT